MGSFCSKIIVTLMFSVECWSSILYLIYAKKLSVFMRQSVGCVTSGSGDVRMSE
jgi:hypothetical protein